LLKSKYNFSYFALGLGKTSKFRLHVFVNFMNIVGISRALKLSISENGELVQTIKLMKSL
jgi:hypothetical protein